MQNQCPMQIIFFRHFSIIQLPKTSLSKPTFRQQIKMTLPIPGFAFWTSDSAGGVFQIDSQVVIWNVLDCLIFMTDMDELVEVLCERGIFISKNPERCIYSKLIRIYL